MQIKQKLSKQIMSLSNGYINKGPQRATVMLPNPEERLQKPTCKPQAHNVLEILSCQSIYDCCSLHLILSSFNVVLSPHTLPSADWLCACAGPKVLLISEVVVYEVGKGNADPCLGVCPTF